MCFGLDLFLEFVAFPTVVIFFAISAYVITFAVVAFSASAFAFAVADVAVSDSSVFVPDAASKSVAVLFSGAVSLVNVVVSASVLSDELVGITSAAEAADVVDDFRRSYAS